MPAIKVQNLSKRYRIGVEEKPAQNPWQVVRSLASSPFKYLGRMLRPPTEEETIWALKDVSFEVEKGEVVGIIGRNGAGKSTLLKILSRITEPTEGRAEIHGRVGSLLEVGTGFHPELTGRENIYLNGAILGMKKAEIDRKFDEIVAFAGVEKFIDTPVKRYSSGMYVRLAFAVAAHLETEILLVDEVLAVGDAEFQKKCLGKMGDVAKEGRTVLFVSHNMGALRRLCKNSIVLHGGEAIFQGGTDESIRFYLKGFESNEFPLYRSFEKKNGDHILSIEIVNKRKNAVFYNNERIHFRIMFEITRDYPDLELNISFWDMEVKLFMFFGSEISQRGFNQSKPFNKGLHLIEFALRKGLLPSGIYYVNLALHRSYKNVLHNELQSILFQVEGDKELGTVKYFV